MSGLLTRADLARDLRALGMVDGDAVMVHAAVSAVGPLLDGPDTVVAALRDVVGPAGTVLAYTDWEIRFHEVAHDDGSVPEPWRSLAAPFDPRASRAARENGVLPEFLRTTPDAVRSAAHGASVAALGARASWFVEPHPLDYGYGPGTPLARLVEAEGRVLLLGAPLDTMTLLHHAEHLADLPGKRVLRYEVPLLGDDGRTEWRWVEEFDTSEPVVEGLAEDYFAEVVEAFLATGRGRRGRVGQAPSVLVDAAAVTTFAVDWLERRVAR